MPRVPRTLRRHFIPLNFCDKDFPSSLPASRPGSYSGVRVAWLEFTLLLHEVQRDTHTRTHARRFAPFSIKKKKKEEEAQRSGASLNFDRPALRKHVNRVFERFVSFSARVFANGNERSGGCFGRQQSDAVPKFTRISRRED